VKKILFFPYAAHPSQYDTYTTKIRNRFNPLGYEVSSIHEFSDPHATVKSAEAFFVGGGNTFLLLKTMYEKNLLEVIRHCVTQGTPYIGSSAGTNLATLSIRTTNDMPIVHPPQFEALKLVAFQINPHYLDPDPHSTHCGETREERIKEFHDHWNAPVLGLREGGYLRVEGKSIQLKGNVAARLFLKGCIPQEYPTGSQLEDLLPAHDESFPSS